MFVLSLNLFIFLFFTLTVMEGDVVVLLSEFGRVRKVKYPGVGKNTHSVLEGLLFLPICISKPNFQKCRKIRGVSISNWGLDSKTNAPS